MAMHPGASHLQHPTEDEWEQYAFGRITGPALDRLEDHLLLCSECQQTLTSVEQFIKAMKGSAEEEKAVSAPSARPVLPFLRWRWLPPLGFVAAAAAVVLVVVVERRPSLEQPQSVTLESYRGEDVPEAHARARQPLELKIDTTGVPANAALWLEVVDGGGKTVWSGAPGVRTPGLTAGTYWVRLYAPRPQLVREFPLWVDP